MKNYKKVALTATCTALLGGAMTTANAANWLMLQGTERADAAPRAKVWGFIQTQYQTDNSTKATAGANAGNSLPPKMIGPNLDSQEAFNVNRARIGIRGQGMPLDGKVNYFLLAEFGNNAITAANSGATNITDASITLNHIEGARVRMGLFKTPGAEEALQAIHVFDYVNFTEGTNALLLERPPEAVYTGNKGPTDFAQDDYNAYTKPVAAFRDVGIQVFDTFKDGSWEHSYAVMYGNGNGLNFSDNDDEKDTYLYYSAEKVFAGKGAFREGLKFWVWQQDGSRELDKTNDTTHNPVAFDRKRSGFGVKYLAKPWRVTFEYIDADGMIFSGPDKPTLTTALPGPVVIANGEKATADAWYLDAGWYIPGTKWDVGVRYDTFNPFQGQQGELEFETITLGAQYMFNKKTRLTINHAMRDFTAVNYGTNAGPNTNLDGVDSRTSIQLTHIF